MGQRKLIILLAALAAVVLGVGADARAEAQQSGRSKAPGCGKGKSGVPEPQDALATPYLQGNASPPLPAGVPKRVSVLGIGQQQIQYGIASNSLPVVVRNNTCKLLTDVKVTGTLRDAAGQLLASVETQGIDPATLGPGEIGIGHLYLGLDVAVPADAEFDLKAGGQKSNGLKRDYRAAMRVEETNLTSTEQFGTLRTTVIGILKNPRMGTVTGPIGVTVVCFDAAGAPVAETSDFAELPPGEEVPGRDTVSFSADLFDGVCPTYLVAASGFDDKALRSR